MRCEPEDLEYLPPGSVLHWEFQHFVVLERAGRAGADIVDPALGRRRVTMAELKRAFTGVALTSSPARTSSPGGPGRLRSSLTSAASSAPPADWGASS